MAKILYGFTSFGLSIASLLSTGLIIAVLFILPPATFLFKQMYRAAFIPTGLALIGLLFYYLQWKIFTTKIVYTALIINIAVLVTDVYLLYELYNSI